MAKGKADDYVIRYLKWLVHDAKVSRKEIAKALGYKHVDYISHLIRGVRRLPYERRQLLRNLVAQYKIKRLIHEVGVSRKTLAKELGYKNVDYISHLARGAKRLPEDKFKKLENIEEKYKQNIVVVVKELQKGEFSRKTVEMLISEAQKQSEEKLLEEVNQAVDTIMRGAKGNFAGLYYYDIVVTKEDSDKILRFYGEENVLDIFPWANNKRLKKMLATFLVILYDSYINLENVAAKVKSVMEEKGIR